MITIYNETKTPWELKKINDTISVMSRASAPKQKGVKTRKMAFISMGDTIDVTKIPGGVNGSIVNVSSKNNDSIYWSHKDLAPVLTNINNENLKNFYLITISLKNRMLINADLIGAMILDRYFANGELTLFVAADSGTFFHLYFASPSEDNMIKYTIGANVSKESIVKVMTLDKVRDKQPEMYRLKLYRPKFLTRVVIVPLDQKEEFELGRSKCKGEFLPYYYKTEDEVDYIINILLKDRYRAVSIWSSINEALDSEVVEKAKANFKVVYKATFIKETGGFKIQKLKVE